MIDYNFLTKNIDKQVFNATSAINGPYVVGQAALGGIIAYILQPGDPGYNAYLQQGYVAATADQGGTTTLWWNGTNILIGTSTAIGTGLANTNAIIAAQGAGTYAATVCKNYTGGGYSDWYLPSIDELYKLFFNQFQIGGFTNSSYYWSSSEGTSQTAYAIFFTTASYTTQFRNTSNIRIRPIRNFSVAIDTPTPWQTWTKPSGAKTAYIVCIGGGGAGGAGCTNATATTRGGGAGGGSSSITIAQVPFYSIPDTLYIQVGIGGIGGTATAGTGNSGTNGGTSYVSCYPTIDMFNCLVIANGGGGGIGGTTIAPAFSGTAGSALSASSTTNPRYLSLCNWVSYGGQTAPVSGFPSASNSTINSNLLVNAGSGGGGLNGSGGQAIGAHILSGDTLASFLKQVSGGAIGGANNGMNGYSQLKPFMYVGGAGGGSNIAGNSGSGGNGTIGSGGGGGGAAGGGGLAGNGGNGGNGLVMIISY